MTATIVLQISLWRPVHPVKSPSRYTPRVSGRTCSTFKRSQLGQLEGPSLTPPGLFSTTCIPNAFYPSISHCHDYPYLLGCRFAWRSDHILISSTRTHPEQWSIHLLEGSRVDCQVPINIQKTERGEEISRVIERKVRTEGKIKRGITVVAM